MNFFYFYYYYFTLLGVTSSDKKGNSSTVIYFILLEFVLNNNLQVNTGTFSTLWYKLHTALYKLLKVNLIVVRCEYY